MKKIAVKAILILGIGFLNFLGANDDSDTRIELSGREVFIPQRLGDLKLYKDSDGFHIIKDDQIYDVKNCFCDPMLRKMTNKQLMTFLGRNKPKIIEATPEEFKNILDQIKEDDLIEITGAEKEALIGKLCGVGGYISVSQMSNGEYRLEAHGRLLGGGFWDYVVVFATIGTGVIILGLAGAAVGVCVGTAKTCAAIGAVGGLIIGGAIAIIQEIKRPCSADEKTPTDSKTPASSESHKPEKTPEFTSKNEPPREYSNERPVHDLPEYYTPNTM